MKGNDRERQRQILEDQIIRRVDNEPTRRYVAVSRPAVVDCLRVSIKERLVYAAPAVAWVMGIREA
jgi:hypothetical protein